MKIWIKRVAQKQSLLGLQTRLKQVFLCALTLSFGCDQAVVSFDQSKLLEESVAKHLIEELDFLDHPHAFEDQLSPINRVSTYDCMPSFETNGGERIYSIELEKRGALAAEIDVKSGQNFIVLVATEDPKDPKKLNCLAGSTRRVAVEDLDPGQYFIVVDGDADSESRFRLSVEPEIYGEWIERAVSPYMVWRRWYDDDPRLSINILEIAPTKRLDIHGAFQDSVCKSVDTFGRQLGAIAGINTSFHTREGFGKQDEDKLYDFEHQANRCTPMNLVKIDGEVHTNNTMEPLGEMTLGIAKNGKRFMELLAPDDNWPEVHHANSGDPVLLPRELYPSTRPNYFHPRTAAGLREDGTLLLLTIDGRSMLGEGVSLVFLQELLESEGAVAAVNFDGGGSSTMWIDGTTLNGVVNYPSDGWTIDRLPDHNHSRMVSDALLIFER